MLKRVRWLATGVAVGAGASLWAERKAKAVAARYRPSTAAGRAIGLPGEVVAALREGRRAMKEKEAELRALSGPPIRQLRPERRRTRA